MHLETIKWREPDSAFDTERDRLTAVFQITPDQEWLATTLAIEAVELAEICLERYCANTIDLSQQQ